MSHSNDLRIEPTRPSAAPKPIETRYPAPQIRPDTHRHGDVAAANHVAAATGGTLQPAYSQFVVDPDTNDVLLRVRHGTTGRILQEVPSAELQTMSRNLTEYAGMLARRRASSPSEKDE